MATASITIADDGESVTVSADFGDKVEPESQAHQMVSVLLESILGNAKRYETIEDTAPEHNVEHSRIITEAQP